MTTGRVGVAGALGRMGEEVRAAVAVHPELEVVGALEAAGHPGVGSAIEGGVEVVADPEAAFADSDVVIDFSIPAATLTNLAVAARGGVAYVTGTTGFSPEEQAELAQFSEQIPLLHAPNFSVAVNVLAWLVREAAQKLGPAYHAELFELHHAAKRDAPSGTALRLAEAVAAGQGVELEPAMVLERAGETGARPAGAIGVQTLRGGDNPGEHTVLFIGTGERLELVHRSTTRAHFASGAARAAAWLIARPPGNYRIEQMLDLE